MIIVLFLSLDVRTGKNMAAYIYIYISEAVIVGNESEHAHCLHVFRLSLTVQFHVVAQFCCG